jgi:hypothetical protein
MEKHRTIAVAATVSLVLLSACQPSNGGVPLEVTHDMGVIVGAQETQGSIALPMTPRGKMTRSCGCLEATTQRVAGKLDQWEVSYRLALRSQNGEFRHSVSWSGPPRLIVHLKGLSIPAPFCRRRHDVDGAVTLEIFFPAVADTVSFTERRNCHIRSHSVEALGLGTRVAVVVDSEERYRSSALTVRLDGTDLQLPVALEWPDAVNITAYPRMLVLREDCTGRDYVIRLQAVGGLSRERVACTISDVKAFASHPVLADTLDHITLRPVLERGSSAVLTVLVDGRASDTCLIVRP